MSGMFSRRVMCDVRDARQDKLVSAAPRVSWSWPTAVVESRRVRRCGELSAD